MKVPAYSPDTDTHYESWDALVAAEANGYAAVGVSGRGVWVVGPFDTPEEARREQARMRARAKRTRLPGDPAPRFFVRPVWRPTSRRLASAASDMVE